MKISVIKNNEIINCLEFENFETAQQFLQNGFIDGDEIKELEESYGVGDEIIEGKFHKPEPIKIDEKQNILNQLSRLDLIIPRILEDIIEQGDFKIHESKINVIEEKKSLRNQLSKL